MTTIDSPRELSVLRYEYKYQLDIFMYHRVRNALRVSTRPDRYSLRGRSGRYFVRSLYFDTDNYLAYQEKVTGIANRIKLRIRSYTCARGDASPLKIELKTRTGSRVSKYSELISLDEYDHFLEKRSWIEGLGSVADEFRRLVLLKSLRPKVLVDYKREALVPRDGSDVRITFDHDLKFSQAVDLFSQDRPSYSACSRQIILEIKTQTFPPQWLESLVRNYELKSVPNSKYSQGIEQTQHTLYR